MSSTSADPHDRRVRLAAFRWREEQTTPHGEVLPRASLIRGFEHDGRRIPLVSMQEIIKPAALPRWPLTLRPSAEGPNGDRLSLDEGRSASPRPRCSSTHEATR